MNQDNLKKYINTSEKITFGPDQINPHERSFSVKE